MVVLNRSLALALSIPLVAQLGLACAPAASPPVPGETPAEITLPPTNTPGNLDKIRRDLRPFSRGVPHTRTRAANCKSCVVDVDVRSVGLTTDVTPLTGPARFRIIGIAKNTDPRDTEDAYSLKPRTEYLLWIKPAALNKAGTSRTRWGLLELPAGPTGPIDTVAIGYVEYCDHERRAGPHVSDTDFKNCDYAHSDRSALRTESRLTLPALFAGSNGPVAPLSFAARPWFDCGGYCCTGTNVMQ